ncbi:MAG: N-acetylmuramic acid 6-phosphate etherase [Bacteroidota bacterium]
MEKITEKAGPYRHLEKMTTAELLLAINQEDQRVAAAISHCLPAIGKLVDAVAERMQEGGRLFYLGAGTSGRLGVLDASEVPPTFGVSPDWVIGLIAGGDKALRRAVEKAEDSHQQAIQDLKAHQIDQRDFVVGIAASGTTPYVVHGLQACRELNIATGCITCNPATPLAATADYPVEVIVGPEFVTGSTRMKAGTAQKLVLNMISTSVMIKMGRVLDNRMVDMQLSNDKLIDRGTKMLVDALNISYELAREKLLEYGSVRAAMVGVKKEGEENNPIE